MTAEPITIDDDEGPGWVHAELAELADGRPRVRLRAEFEPALTPAQARRLARHLGELATAAER